MLLLADRCDQQLAARLEDELDQVGRRFADELASDLSCVNVLIEHIERYRGKMLRPTLALVSGMAASTEQGGAMPPSSPALRVIATVVEMIHMATLIHDDVLDEAETRRRGDTVNRLKGNETAVMLGDYLISHAYHLCSRLEMPAVSRLISASTNVVCEGELLQLANRGNWALEEGVYFDIIRRKTAVLCATSCQAAAVLQGAEPAIVAALNTYGEKLGVAYQIVDDLLDLMGEEGTVGKSLGRDLIQGEMTLPLIHFRQHALPAQQKRMEAVLGEDVRCQLNSSTGPDAMLAVRDLIGETESLDYAQRWAKSLVEEARSALMMLPDSPARQFLLDTADAVLTRPC